MSNFHITVNATRIPSGTHCMKQCVLAQRCVIGTTCCHPIVCHLCVPALQMPQDWDAVKAAVDARSVHAEPFPYTATIETIGQLFAQHGEVRQVRLQRFVDPQVKGGVFAGSAIVEMGTQEQAEALLAGEVQHAGAVLRLQSKAAHLQAREAVRALVLVAACSKCVANHAHCAASR